MKKINYLLVPILLLGLVSKSSAQDFSHKGSTLTHPKQVWKEHWFEHLQELKLVDSNQDVAVYYDKNMPDTVKWPLAMMAKCWVYIKRNYGNFGPDPRLYVILHRSTGTDYSGGHPAPFFDASHDYRNVIDCGLQDWSRPIGEQIGMPVHEMGHIVTSASHGAKGSPSDVLWGDSKFMEIFNYDVLNNVGMGDEARKVFDQMQYQYDDFPRPGTQWFKNWFFPIYSKYGEGKVLDRYFELLALHFPKSKNGRFKRDLNFGEFVHFWSGAAAINLKDLAGKAFGWTIEYDLQFKQAQKAFPGLQYKTDSTSR